MGCVEQPIAIFAGPSLPSDVDLSRVKLFPPAKRGDIAAAAERGFRCIIFADGMFFQEPSPTHKELIGVLRSGVFMVGTASMGALRATELSSMGMKGVGTAFAAVRKGVIRDESEFAVAMCPYTYQSLTVPLLNIRRLLFMLRQRGFDKEDLGRIWSIASRLYFLDRTTQRFIYSLEAGQIRHWQDVKDCLASWDFNVKFNDVRQAVAFVHSVSLGKVCLEEQAEPSLDLYF